MKKHPSGGFGRCCWIYGSQAVGDESPVPERRGCEGRCAGRHLEEGSGRVVDPYMGKGHTEDCGTQMRQRQTKKGSSEPIIFIRRMREPAVWERRECTCACMRGRGAGSSQPARLKQQRQGVQAMSPK